MYLQKKWEMKMHDTLDPLDFNPSTPKYFSFPNRFYNLSLSFPTVINLFYWWKREQYIHTLSFAGACLAGSTVSGMLDWESLLQLVMFTVFMKPQSTEGLTRTFGPETFRKIIKAAIQNHVGGESLCEGGKYSHEQIP